MSNKNIQRDDQILMLLEDMRGDIQLVAEGVSVVQRDLSEFKEETRNNFKSFRSEFDNFKQEMTEFKFEMAEFKDEMTEFKDETKSFRQETADNFQAIFEWQSNFSDNFDEEIASIRIELEEIKEEFKKRPTGKALDVLEEKIFNLETRVGKVEKIKA